VGENGRLRVELRFLELQGVTKRRVCLREGVAIILPAAEDDHMNRHRTISLPAWKSLSVS
jgi:hypothetical protein